MLPNNIIVSKNNEDDQKVFGERHVRGDYQQAHLPKLSWSPTQSPGELHTKNIA